MIVRPCLNLARWIAAISLSFLVAAANLAALEAEKKPPPAALLSLHVVPADVTLRGERASQQFLVLGEYADGISRDVTSLARIELSQPGMGEIASSGIFKVGAAGEVVLTANFGGRAAKSRIRIEASDKPHPFTFARDIGGILTKRGCNDTMCHGGVKGRGGFRLSVYGQLPTDDYKYIVEGGTFRVLVPDVEPRNPRINLKEPEKSLVLLKPTFSIPHEGGVRFEVGSTDYQKIKSWIQAGAPYGEDAEKHGGTVQRVEVFPKEIVLDPKGQHQLVVTAVLSNGRREDITNQVRFVAETPAIADVSEEGLIEAKGRGETNVIIRAAGGFSLNVTVGVIEKPVVNYPKIESRNYIDQFVQAKLRKFQVVPSELASDAEFLRRICLDLTGTLPPPHRVREFLADKRPDKRNRLIEILLNSPEFVDYWSFRFSDLLRVTFATASLPKPTKAYGDWVTNSIAANKPYDQMARERLAGQGYSAAARNFYYVSELTTPEQLMPELIRLFMGRRIECAQCHSHPFESWTQEQFWGLAAFVGGYTEIKDSTLIIDVLGGGHVDQPKEMTVIHPRTKAKVVPTFLDGKPLPEDQWLDPRMRLAEWITSHPYFAEAAANRIWSFFFGRGIVDPVDDFRSSNSPTHPELLNALAKDLKDHGFDLKHLMRTIVQSRTYQTSGTPNATNVDDRINYSYSWPRPLEAAVLLDAVSSATGVPEQFKFHSMAGGGAAPIGARATEMIPDICPSQFMDAFGRSTRKTLPVEAPQPNLRAALHMVAGSTYTTKISQKGGRLDQLIQQGASDEQVIEEVYLAALTRFPVPEERQRLLSFLARRGTRREETLSGLVWAVLTSREFANNH